MPEERDMTFSQVARVTLLMEFGLFALTIAESYHRTSRQEIYHRGHTSR